MIIAITGGSGFIGKRLVHHHIQQGDQVRLLSRKPPLKEISAQYFLGDLSNSNVDLSSFVDNADILYHCAGEVNNEQIMRKLHVDGTQKLVNLSHGRVGRWVQLSSVGAYGVCRNGVVTEESPENPLNVYEKTKTQSDEIVKKSGIPFVILRPSSVFGSAMPNKSLFQLVYMIRKGLFFYLGKKGALMNYVHVEDVVQALVHCGGDNHALGKSYNLSQTIEIEQMVQSLLSSLGLDRKIFRFPEQLIRKLVQFFSVIPNFPLTISRIDALTGRCYYDSSKIMSELGFKFKLTLENSLVEFVADLDKKKRV